MIALSTFALAAAGCTTTPPSTASHTLWNTDLAGGAVEGDFHRARPERARSLSDRNPDRPAVRPLRLVIGHLRQCLEYPARLRSGSHALEPERDGIHALVGRHLIDQALDGKGVEHMAYGAPMLQLDSVRNAAPLDVLR